MRFPILLLGVYAAITPAAAATQASTVLFLSGRDVEPEVISVRAGGNVRVEATDECDYGWIADVEDHVALAFGTASGGGPLYIYTEGDGDTMLLVIQPDSTMVCDDDSHGNLDPLVSIPDAQTGAYAIWVGAYSQNEFHDATLYISDQNPGSGTSTEASGRPDLSLDATYGVVTLDVSFSPDPHAVSVSAGGPIDVDVSGCTYGFVANAPTVDLLYNGSGADLYFFVRADEDTTLLINRADATWSCDDDSLGDSNPVVTIPNAATGLYDIWVGTYSGAPANATLYISTKAAK